MQPSSLQNITMWFGAAVRRRRRRLGLSQEAFAELTELHRTYIADVERGTRNVSLRNVEKIALALGVTISELFREYPTPQPPPE